MFKEQTNKQTNKHSTVYRDINYPVVLSGDAQLVQAQQSRHSSRSGGDLDADVKTCHHMRHGSYIPGICYYLVSWLKHWLALPCALVFLQILKQWQPRFLLWRTRQTDLRGSEFSTPVLHSRGSGLKSQPRDPTYLHWCSLWPSSVPPGIFQDNRERLNWVSVAFLQRRIQFISL
jgi:hypothetical protein